MKSMLQAAVHMQVSNRDIPVVFNLSPLHTASSFKLRHTVALLLEEGASEVHDSYGVTAIYSSRHEEITKLLLQHGMEINLRDQPGRTPLMHSAWRGNEAVMRVLLEASTDMTFQNKHG